MRYILVKGVAVIDWNDETPYEFDNEQGGVPFELEGMGEEFLDQEVPEGYDVCWDGGSWWMERHKPTIDEILEVTDNHTETIDMNSQDIEDIILLLAEVLGTEDEILEEE